MPNKPPLNPFLQIQVWQGLKHRELVSSQMFVPGIKIAEKTSHGHES